MDQEDRIVGLLAKSFDTAERGRPGLGGILINLLKDLDLRFFNQKDVRLTSIPKRARWAF